MVRINCDLELNTESLQIAIEFGYGVIMKSSVKQTLIGY